MGDRITAEDFGRVSLATRGEGEVALRVDSEVWLPWRVRFVADAGGWRSDEGMAATGWTPVVESRTTEHAQDNAGRNRQRLVDHIADQDRVIRRRNDEIAVLRAELRDAQAPLSIESMAAAWEAAEEVEECCEGDVLIIRDDEDNYLVRRMDDRSRLDSTARILSRAPKPELPEWQALADVLADMGHLSPTGHAKALYERGVRATDGDE